jgi:hypothetical protein
MAALTLMFGPIFFGSIMAAGAVVAFRLAWSGSIYGVDWFFSAMMLTIGCMTLPIFVNCIAGFREEATPAIRRIRWRCGLLWDAFLAPMPDDDPAIRIVWQEKEAS